MHHVKRRQSCPSCPSCQRPSDIAAMAENDAAIGDGTFAIMVRLGLGPEEIYRRQMSFAVARAETEVICASRNGWPIWWHCRQRS